MRSLLYSAALLFVLSVYAPGVAAVEEVIPTSASLTFRLTPTGGLQLIHTYDLSPSVACRITIKGKGQKGNQFSPTVTLKKMSTLNRRVRLQVAGLPSVVKEVNNAVPIVHLIAWSNCGGQILHSNVFARYVRCGQDGIGMGFSRKRVSMLSWLRALAEKLN